MVADAVMIERVPATPEIEVRGNGVDDITDAEVPLPLTGITFESFGIANAAPTFRLLDSQIWGNGNLGNYTVGKGVHRKVIPTDRFFTSFFDQLVSANADKDDLPVVKSKITNVSCYEA